MCFDPSNRFPQASSTSIFFECGLLVTTQDFVRFWGKIFAFVLLEMIEISQGFKTFESI
jgi:hypothetical protein